MGGGDLGDSDCYFSLCRSTLANIRYPASVPFEGIARSTSRRAKSFLVEVSIIDEFI